MVSTIQIAIKSTTDKSKISMIVVKSFILSP
nr:MAG TPA: hypothetical protein [Caudoviricetes sp.]DAT53699.1 MAG TPA: hypothetical protein [Caudoviricetes sp.]